MTNLAVFAIAFAFGFYIISPVIIVLTKVRKPDRGVDWSPRASKPASKD